MKNRIVTCTECPNGCQVNVQLDEEKIVQISDFMCPRGKEYAKNEIIAPRRVLTTTVKTQDGRVFAVKTDAPVLKKNLFEIMKKVNSITAKTPVNIGDVIYKNIDENINLISSTILI